MTSDLALTTFFVVFYGIFQHFDDVRVRYSVDPSRGQIISDQIGGVFDRQFGNIAVLTNTLEEVNQVLNEIDIIVLMMLLVTAHKILIHMLLADFIGRKLLLQPFEGPR